MLSPIFSLILSLWLTNRFSNDLPDLNFHLSIIKLYTIKLLAKPIKALGQGVGQWDYWEINDYETSLLTNSRYVVKLSHYHILA